MAADAIEYLLPYASIYENELKMCASSQVVVSSNHCASQRAKRSRIQWNASTSTNKFQTAKNPLRNDRLNSYEKRRLSKQEYNGSIAPMILPPHFFYSNKMHVKNHLKPVS